MPGLIAFGRRWDVGSDDLVYPGFAEVVLRGSWLIALSIVFDLHRDSFECNSGHLLMTFYIGMLTILAVTIMSDVVMVMVSMRGSMMYSTPRRHLAKVLYLKLLLLLFELAWTVLGTVWAFDAQNTCDYWVVLAAKICSIFSWLVLIVLLGGAFIVFDPLGGRGRADLQDDETSSAIKKLWEFRCQVLCCCCVGKDDNSRDAFNSVSQLLTNFFKGLDVVPTDIAAGLILAQIEQEKLPPRLKLDPLTCLEQPRPYLQASPRRVEASTEPPLVSLAGSIGEEEHEDLPYPRPQDWMNVPAAAHYIKFAMGCYGWPIYMYMNLCTCGACKLCSHTKCCACLQSSAVVMDDNCCACNTSAIIKMTGIAEEDIVYASFHNKLYEIPFYVALDHSQQAVVIAIRGTMSLKDALTDATTECEDFHVEGAPCGGAHKGILQATKFILNTINNLQLLQSAFDRVPDYKLVVTGHSLGAGAATLLAMLLRPDYSDLRCYAFSPPGWLLSLPLSRYTEDFVCSVVLSKDMVPRLGMYTMEYLKTRILKVVRDTHIPKYRVLVGGAFHNVFGKSSLHEEIPSVSAQSSLVASNSAPKRYTDDPGNFEQSVEDAILASSRARFETTRLYPPGHIIFIDEREPKSSCLGMPTYCAAWARAEVFDEIIVSPRMVQDHLPDAVDRALQQLVETDATPRYLAQLCVPEQS